MTEFYLAHISDLHFASLPNRMGIHHPASKWDRLKLLAGAVRPGDRSAKITGSYSESVFRSLIDRLSVGYVGGNYSGIASPYDLVVVSGDVATHGSRMEMAAAKILLGELWSQIGKANANAILSLVPGNHDRFRGLLNFPGSYEFERDLHFSREWRLSVNSGCAKLFDGSRVKAYSYTKGNEVLGIVYSDFSLSSVFDAAVHSLSWLDVGKVNNSIKSELDKAFDACRRAEVPVIWVMHFPPGKGGLKNESAVIEFAERYDVHCVLAGHVHEPDSFPIFLTDRKGIEVSIAGSALAYGEQNWFREMRVSVQNQRVVDVFIQPIRCQRRKTLMHGSGEYVFL